MKTQNGINSSERGEGQIGSIIMLGVFIALAIAATQMGPIYWDNYQFEDRLTNIAGRFPPNKESDARALAAIKEAIEDSGLTPYLDISACSVTSAGGIGGLRTVSCTYTREYKLFGSKKTKVFENSVSRPMF
jgi:3-oxoacyl-(acyl-carrier-protein) synthase